MNTMIINNNFEVNVIQLKQYLLIESKSLITSNWVVKYYSKNTSLRTVKKYVSKLNPHKS